MSRSSVRRLTAAALAVIALAPACGGGDEGGSGSEITAEEMAALFVDSGAPEDEAQCVGEALEGEVTRDEVQQFIESEDGSDLDEDLIVQIGTALAGCTA